MSASLDARPALTPEDNGRQLQPDGLQLLIVQGLPRLGVLQFSLQEAAAE